MALLLRRIVWPDGSSTPDDYEVIDERGEKIGRMYLTHRRGDTAWTWTVYSLAVHGKPPAGMAPTREAAMAAFKAAWATCQPREE
jgi:hypothetical protein